MEEVVALFKSRVLKALEERGWSQNNLSIGKDAASESSVSKILKGDRDPQLTTVKKIADALSMTVGELVDEGGEEHPAISELRQLLRSATNAKRDDLIEDVWAAIQLAGLKLKQRARADPRLKHSN